MKLFKIRWQLLLIILPIALIPLIIIVSITVSRNFSHLDLQTTEMNLSLLNQVSVNLEANYQRYLLTLKEITLLDNFNSIIKAPPFNKLVDELSLQVKLGEYDKTPKFDSIWRNALTNIDGDLCLIQLDKYSNLPNNLFVINYFTNNYIKIDCEKLLEDPLLLDLKNNPEMKMAFGKLHKGVIETEDIDNRFVFIYPYYGNKTTFDKVLLVILNESFIVQTYSNLKNLNSGVLYIVDKYDNIISSNHPAWNKDFSKEIKQKQFPVNFFDMINLTQPQVVINPRGKTNPINYQLLNANKNILNKLKIKRALNKLTYIQLDKENLISSSYDMEFKRALIDYQGVNYLAVMEYAYNSHSKLVYLQTVTQIRAPIYRLIFQIILLSFIIVLIVIIISFVLSKSLTDPITTLSRVAAENAEGSFKLVQINSKNEIGELARIFNHMITRIAELLEKTKEITRMESELNAARQIQSQVLPHPDECLEGYEMAHGLLTATEVGGDSYDFVRTKQGNWISIGDVSGHGLESGIIALISEAAFINGTIIFDKMANLENAPAKMYDFVNKTLVFMNKIRADNDCYMTQNYFLEKDGTFFCAGAHEIAILYRKKTNQVEEIDDLAGRTAFMGLSDKIDPVSSICSFKMEKGDILLLYTDGVIEAKNSEKEQYGLDRLKTLVLNYAKEPLNKMKEAIYDEVRAHALDGDVARYNGFFADDITMIIMRRK